MNKLTARAQNRQGLNGYKLLLLLLSSLLLFQNDQCCKESLADSGSSPFVGILERELNHKTGSCWSDLKHSVPSSDIFSKGSRLL